MNKIPRLAALILVAAILTVTSVFPASAESNGDYYTYLRNLGFPADYAEKLAELHLLHPSWNFEPLPVTGLNGKYTWDYVIHMETEDAANRSLVTPNPDYAAYRHPTNTTLYDSGWYQASATAVEYFMDPRNFLNEKDIFQFEELSFKDSVSVSELEAALAGTFMAGAYLENGKTCAEYFYEVGRALGVSPLHLAARARQEQGLVGTGPQVTGTIGDRLWYYYGNNIQYEGSVYIKAPATGYTEESLKKYNGLYNFYNIGAGGTGKFAILLGAAKEAETGTASMAAEWGSGGRWDAKWKSIYGGAYKIRNSYINNYQNTRYLQKWNVDNRSKSAAGASRNFWGQYMQNIGAALSESRTAYATLASGGCLDCEFTFLIPVYSGMPASCPDPAGGSCPDYAESDTKYSFASGLTLPVSASSRDGYITQTISVASGDKLTVSGWSVHTYGIDGYEHSIDGGDWTAMAASFSEAVAGDNPEYVRCAAPASINSFSAEVGTSGLAPGAHTVVLRGKADFGSSPTHTDNSYYLIAAVKLDIKESSTVTVTVKGGPGDISSVLQKNSVYILPAPAPVTDRCFAGWTVVSDSARMFLPEGTAMTLLGNITLTPVYIDMRNLRGAELKISEPASLRFTAAISYDSYNTLVAAAGAGNITLGIIICKTADLGALTPDPAGLAAAGKSFSLAAATGWRHTARSSGEYYGFDAGTSAILPQDYATPYSAAACVRVKYTDASVAYICASYTPSDNSRSAKSVAAAALADTSRTYGATESAILERIAK